MPLTNYQWRGDSFFENDLTEEHNATIPLGREADAGHNRTLVRSMFTISAGFSLTPNDSTHLAAFATDALTVRATMWAAPGGDPPPFSAVDPFAGGPSSDLILGWAELVPTVVVNGFQSSLCLKFAMPDNPIMARGQRKVGSELTVGCTIAFADPNAFWPRGTTGVAARWSYNMGARWLIANNE